jgi:hypothetical protein
MSRTTKEERDYLLAHVEDDSIAAKVVADLAEIERERDVLQEKWNRITDGEATWQMRSKLTIAIEALEAIVAGDCFGKSDAFEVLAKVRG